jgi:hypothetical protein
VPLAFVGLTGLDAGHDAPQPRPILGAAGLVLVDLPVVDRDPR